MDAGVLERLEARVSALERKVKGDFPDHDQSVVQRLAIINNKLTSAIQGIRKIILKFRQTNHFAIILMY